MTRRNTTAIDIAIGIKLKEARVSAGLSQETAASQIGVTRQQFRKYEVGEDRITAGYLATYAKFFKRPIDFFFADLEQIMLTPAEYLKKKGKKQDCTEIQAMGE